MCRNFRRTTRHPASGTTNSSPSSLRINAGLFTKNKKVEEGAGHQINSNQQSTLSKWKKTFRSQTPEGEGDNVGYVGDSRRRSSVEDDDVSVTAGGVRDELLDTSGSTEEADPHHVKSKLLHGSHQWRSSTLYGE